MHTLAMSAPENPGVCAASLYTRRPYADFGSIWSVGFRVYIDSKLDLGFFPSSDADTGEEEGASEVGVALRSEDRIGDEAISIVDEPVEMADGEGGASVAEK